MDAPTTFFLIMLILQATFSGVLVWLVARRFPRRIALYRFLAPAAVPAFFFTIVTISFLSMRKQMGLRLGLTDAGAVFRFFLAYFVLWLIGLLLASMVIRWTRPRA